MCNDGIAEHSNTKLHIKKIKKWKAREEAKATPCTHLLSTTLTRADREECLVSDSVPIARTRAERRMGHTRERAERSLPNGPWPLMCIVNSAQPEAPYASRAEMLNKCTPASEAEGEGDDSAEQLHTRTRTISPSRRLQYSQQRVHIREHGGVSAVDCT